MSLPLLVWPVECFICLPLTLPGTPGLWQGSQGSMSVRRLQNGNFKVWLRNDTTMVRRKMGSNRDVAGLGLTRPEQVHYGILFHLLELGAWQRNTVSYSVRFGTCCPTLKTLLPACSLRDHYQLHPQN